jgi:hypothetical protein
MYIRLKINSFDKTKINFKKLLTALGHHFTNISNLDN